MTRCGSHYQKDVFSARTSLEIKCDWTNPLKKINMSMLFLSHKFELSLRDDRLSSRNISTSLSCFLTVPEASSDRYCQRKDYRDLWSDKVLPSEGFHLFISFHTLAAEKPMPQKTLSVTDFRRMGVVTQVRGLQPFTVQSQRLSHMKAGFP